MRIQRGRVYVNAEVGSETFMKAFLLQNVNSMLTMRCLRFDFCLVAITEEGGHLYGDGPSV